MKKIPTVFTRVFENHRVVGIKDEITPGCELAFYTGIATEKIDGSCCAIIDDKFYKHYDAKTSKKPPAGAIPCCDPDPITGHWPHWVEVGDSSSDKWFIKAMQNTRELDIDLRNGTYEAVGPHFNGNPHGLVNDILVRHGMHIVELSRDFESISNWLNNHKAEGLVFWLNGEPVCKIKRTDFGYEWPVKSE